jgi:hypothetical protein
VLRHGDILDEFPDRSNSVYIYVVEEAQRYTCTSGLLINNLEEL